MPQMEPRSQTRTQTTRIEVTSSAFEEGSLIPKRHAADGEDLSPPLRFRGIPTNARTLAIVCEDPDVAAGTFVHWLAWNIPAEQRELEEGVPPNVQIENTVQGQNGFGKPGYGGPKPPPGEEHRYLFRVYALDIELELAPGATRADFQRALKGHVIAEGVLTGKYGW